MCLQRWKFAQKLAARKSCSPHVVMMSGLGLPYNNNGVPGLPHHHAGHFPAISEPSRISSGASMEAPSSSGHAFFPSRPAEEASLLAVAAATFKQESAFTAYRPNQGQGHRHTTAAIPAETNVSANTTSPTGSDTKVPTTQGDGCGACHGRHRRHQCGRERVDVDENFKDDNCAACVGKHRPHTCVKGKPEHLRRRKKKNPSK